MGEISKFIIISLILLAGALLITKITEKPSVRNVDIVVVGGIGDRRNMPTVSPAIFSSPSPLAANSPPLPIRELVIYTYDGITSEWGLGPKIFPKFEGKCGCKLKVVAKGDVGAFISQLIFEKENPMADIALGTDNTFMQKAIDGALFEPYGPNAIDSIDPFLFPKLPNTNLPDYRLIPFDWGYLAFVYDSNKVGSPPKSLEDLTLPEYRKKIIIEDARTSSPGKVFLHWVASEYGDKAGDYLSRLKPNLLTITPGWTEGYNLFLQGEVPIVLSYSTSPAYHIVNENTTRYKAALFQSLPRQVEFVSIVKGSKNRKLAEEFIDFMLSANAQMEIPLGNFMYPSVAKTPIPDAFRLAQIPIPSNYTIVDDEKREKIWEEALSN